MREYWKPWRRRAGGVALTLACALAVGWMRSGMITDVLALPGTMRKNESMYSLALVEIFSWKQSVVWERVVLESGDDTSADFEPYPQWKSFSRDEDVDWEVSELKLNWHLKRCGFSFASTSVDLLGIRISVVIIPYWSLVIPVTAISVWLLLSRPRKKQPAADR